jgi:hypothetical protein
MDVFLFRRAKRKSFFQSDAANCSNIDKRAYGATSRAEVNSLDANTFDPPSRKLVSDFKRDEAIAKCKAN